MKSNDYKKLSFDSKSRRYYLEDSNGHNISFLTCGTHVYFELLDRQEDIYEEKEGTIEYSSFVSRGYYISLDNGKSYIPLFCFKRLALRGSNQ
jgi:hypothetical protein